MRDALDWEFAKGRFAFHKGEPFPPRPYDENGLTLTDDQMVFARWAGYMLARAKYIQECARVKALLTDPDPDDRPPKAIAA